MAVAMQGRKIGLVALGLSAWAAAAVAGPAQDARREGQARQRPLEFPDDPPAEASAASTGRRSPATAFVRGKFATVQVNVDAQGLNILGDAANEPSIAVDPLDPKRMAIGWRQFDTVASNFRQAGWGWSANGGKSWTFPGKIQAGTFRSDPVLASDSSGVFYYDSLSTPGGQYLCQLFKSTDGGKTWGAALPAFGGDKAWFTIDRSGGPGDGHVYEAWSLFAGCCGNDTFTRSVNAGQTFQTPLSLPSSPIWGTLAVASNGTLHIGGVDPNTFTFIVVRSSNAQNPLQTPTFTSAVSVNLGGDLNSGAGPNPGGLLGQVWIATDPGNPNAVYLLCSVDPPGPDPLDVRFARSLNGGQTWGASVRVNDDQPGSHSWQWFGTMAVAPGGRIDVVWNDTRASGADDVSQLYYASSNDGGASFSTNEPASPPWNSHVGWPNQDKIGDYYDMVSDAQGAHLAWSATLNGEQDVYYTHIRP